MRNRLLLFCLIAVCAIASIAAVAIGCSNRYDYVDIVVYVTESGTPVQGAEVTAIYRVIYAPFGPSDSISMTSTEGRAIIKIARNYEKKGGIGVDLRPAGMRGSTGHYLDHIEPKTVYFDFDKEQPYTEPTVRVVASGNQ